MRMDIVSSSFGTVHVTDGLEFVEYRISFARLV